MVVINEEWLYAAVSDEERPAMAMRVLGGGMVVV